MESALHYAHGAVDEDHARLALDTGNHLSWSLSDDFSIVGDIVSPAPLRTSS